MYLLFLKIINYLVLKQAVNYIGIVTGGGEMSKLNKIIVEEKFSSVDEEKRKKKFNELFVKIIKQAEKSKTA